MFAELATNAILHKDYSRPDYVGLYVCADRMTFVNHNRPLPPVTIEDLNERESFDERGCVNSELKVCLVKPDFRFGTAVGILDQIRPMPPSPNPCDTAWGSCNPGRPLS